MVFIIFAFVLPVTSNMTPSPERRLEGVTESTSKTGVVIGLAPLELDCESELNKGLNFYVLAELTLSES